MNLDGIINKIKQVISPSVENGGIVSPIPLIDYQAGNNPAYQAYLQRNWEADNTPAQPSTFVPKTIKYPDSWSNASPHPDPAKFAMYYKKAFGEYPANYDANSAPTPAVLSASVAPTPPPNLNELTANIKKGLTAYGAPPITEAAGSLATAGAQLPDPYLPAILSLIETGGGRAITRGDNNYFNVLPTRAGVNYPDAKTAIEGGDGHKGLFGLLKGGLYDQYLKSGNIADFFMKYSPPTDDNAALDEQIKRYNSIKKQYFGQ